MHYSRVLNIDKRSAALDIAWDLPPFQPVATRILRLSAQDPRTSLDLVRAIESEPAFSSELLQVANSPLFGFAETVTTISHAVALLGTERIKLLALRLAMKGYMHGAATNSFIRECWLHSIACAEVAAELGSVWSVAKDAAYTAGLVHDIGRLGLLRARNKHYESILASPHETVHASLAAEEQLLGANHCDVGGCLMEKCKFPPELIEAARCHHYTFDMRRGAPLVQVIQFACALADALQFSAIRCSRVADPEELLRKVKASESQRATIRNKLTILEAVILERIGAIEPNLCAEYKYRKETAKRARRISAL